MSTAEHRFALLRAARRLSAFVERRPVSTMFVAAFVVRLLVVGVLSLRSSPLFSDEDGYLRLVRELLSGRLDDPGYDRHVIDSYRGLRGYVVPLGALTDAFGHVRLMGRLWSALLGAAAVALAVVAARTITSPRRALLAGAITMLLPSQVVFSSVALRESTVWIAIALIGTSVALLPRVPARAQLLLAAVATGALVWLWLTRTQTALATTLAGALTLVVCAVRAPRRIAAAAATVAVALLAVPMLVGAGPAGIGFATSQLGRLDVIRWNMAVGAESAIDARPTTFKKTSQAQPSKASQVRDAVGRLPRGVVAVLARPFPWEGAASMQARAAQLENLLWLPLYAAAALGARRRLRDPLTVFIVLLVGALVALAAVSQGNLGTAYRHRGQLVWALTVLATAAPALRLRRRRGVAAQGER